MAVVGFLVFASALAASIFVLWSTLAPALPRIVAILSDGVDRPAWGYTFEKVNEPRNRIVARTATLVTRPSFRVAA